MNIIVDGLMANYQDEGRGPAILLLAGWGQDATSFDQLSDELKGRYRVVRLDLPGFGGSHLPSEAWDVGRYSQFVAGFITKLKLRPAVMVGHSFGGRVIIKGVAAKLLSPQKVVLIASAGIKPPASARSTMFMILAKAGKLVTAPLPADLRRHLREWLYGAAGSRDYLEAGQLKGTFTEVIKEDLSADAAKMSVPTLLIWGEQDDVTPLAQGKSLATAIPKSTLAVVPDAGHFVHLQKASHVLDLIQDFIK